MGKLGASKNDEENGDDVISTSVGAFPMIANQRQQQQLGKSKEKRALRNGNNVSSSVTSSGDITTGNEPVRVGAIPSEVLPRLLGESKTKRDMRNMERSSNGAAASVSNISAATSTNISTASSNVDQVSNGLGGSSGSDVNNLDRFRDKMLQLEETTNSKAENPADKIADTVESTINLTNGTGPSDEAENLTGADPIMSVDLNEEMAGVHDSNRADEMMTPGGESVSVSQYHNENQLMEATPVLDHNASGELPIAQHFDEEQQVAATRKRCQQDFVQASGLLLVGTLALVGIALLVIFLLDTRGGNDTVSPAASPTASPTHVPTTLEDVLKGLLPEDTLRVIANDLSETTPQSRAFQWLKDDLDANEGLYSDKKFVQRFALVTLYYATNGMGWFPDASQGWLDHGLDECDWGFSRVHDNIFEDDTENIETYQMAASPCALSSGNSSNTKLATTELSEEYRFLWLPEIEMEGTLPNELYLMTSLQILALWGNPLASTTLSSHIGKLTNLEALALSTADLTGSLPSEIGLCTNLTALVLPTNKLSGTIPSSIGLLTNLDHLWLHENHLSGPLVTELGLLWKMKTLYLLLNNFEGTIPSEIGNLSQLKDLNIHTLPLLNGTLPTELGRLTSLEALRTNGNFLTGPVPSEIGLLENLYLWYGQECFLSGTIPVEITHIPSLTYLSLRNNQLSGTLPVKLLTLEWLFSLYLRDNLLTGSIPNVGGNLSQPLNFGELLLSGNRLTGTIPQDTMARMPYLDWLWLHGNRLTGQIPSEIGAMEFIFDLQLQDNNLSGNLPSELGLLNASAFWVFNISNNPLLTGEVPEELCVLEEEEILAFDCLNDQLKGLCGCSSCACELDLDEAGMDPSAAASDANATLDAVPKNEPEA